MAKLEPVTAKFGIPPRFFNERYQRKNPAVAYTVGDLKKLLEELPNDLRVIGDYKDRHGRKGALLEVFNINEDKRCLTLDNF